MTGWWRRLGAGRRLEREELRLRRGQMNELGIELALTKAARDRAEAAETYWRQRAERFMDQIGMSSAIISAPVMTEPAPPATDDMSVLFGALSRASINDTQTQAPPATAVNGVDPDAAREAVAAFLK